jgi:uncharacterized membrane protein YkoI
VAVEDTHRGDDMDTRIKAIAAGATILVLGGLGAGAVVASATGSDVNPFDNGDLDRAEQVALDHVGEGTVSGSETEDDGGATAYEVEITRADGSEVDVDLDAGYTVVHTSEEGRGAEDDDGDDDEGVEADDRLLTDTESTSAREAALAEVGAGTVTEVSAEDTLVDGAEVAYEVEVTRPDGTEVEVGLDARFTVVSTVTDDD